MYLDNDYYILSTLGLSGGWLFKDNKKKIYLSKVYDDYLDKSNKDTKMIEEYMKNSLNHLNIEFVMKNGSLYNYDVLSFGTLRVIKGKNAIQKILNKIGPDIMDETTTFELFKNRILEQENKKIGIILMNQKVISGIGNYLRADVLYLSKVSPFRLVKKLTNNEIKNIFFNCKLLTWSDYNLKNAIKLGYYTKHTKIPKDYDRMFFVYKQDTDIHNNIVHKKELYEGNQKRFIYYVPKIQK